MSRLCNQMELLTPANNHEMDSYEDRNHKNVHFRFQISGCNFHKFALSFQLSILIVWTRLK